MSFFIFVSVMILTVPPMIIGFVLVPFYSRLGIFNRKTYNEVYRNNSGIYGKHSSPNFLLAEFLIFSAALMSLSFIGAMMTGDLYANNYYDSAQPNGDVRVVESEIEIQYIY